MHAARLLGTMTLCLAATLAHAAGFRFIQVPADAEGPVLNGAMWYPCSELPGEIDLGGMTFPGTKDCPITGDKLPLVVISHGRGGNFIGHHDTAETLADAGFIVAAINHPGDTHFDQSRSDNLSVWIERPSDIKRLVDFMLDASPAASNIDPQRIGFFGFSRGGYTGLVAIGANPDWTAATAFCQESSSYWCEQIRRKEFPMQPLAHDPKIKAAVIADPLSVFFATDSLASVKVPVQLWASEHGGDGVRNRGIGNVDRNLPSQHEYHVVANSGHFAFLSPCPPALAKAVPEICADMPDFDRVAFHKQFNSDVLTFFRDQLGDR
jgi:predicted dienelactone hydrolase